MGVEETYSEPADRTREELKKMIIDPSNPEKFFWIGCNLHQEETAELFQFLVANVDIFAWSPHEMRGITPEVIVHELQVNPARKPIVQKQRRLAGERARAVSEEVEKLLKAGFIREVKYPTWVSNPVCVKKKTGDWRVCIDFTDLNKACPKDSFPLPKIDQLIDSISGYERMSIFDAFSGYHQIPMAEHDQDKTGFITPTGTYCYKVMPFGLKNAGATYQRLVSRMFDGLIGKNLEAYVDDTIIKSRTGKDHLKDLTEAFSRLREFGMKLNAKKSSFGVSSGKFLGHLVSRRGIEANPSKIDAIRNLKMPTRVRDVQQLNGMVAALSRFISRSSDKCHSFFQVLKKGR